jgi:alcohol-forming fatty acyl-CoA reductase
MLSIYKKIHKFCDVMAYFANRKWYFTNNNVQALWKKLDPRDQELFFFDVDRINWRKFVNESFMGIRTYLLKEDPKNIPAALKRFKRYVWDIQSLIIP